MKAVSLFMRLWVEMTNKCVLVRTHGQPLHEAVSWNKTLGAKKYVYRSSASSWGCELKSYLRAHNWLLPGVSLFMRLWVEMRMMSLRKQSDISSASSWGCELKCDSVQRVIAVMQSASSWGCELKCFHCRILFFDDCQPLHEAVSWNRYSPRPIWGCEVSLFMRLWVEMHLTRTRAKFCTPSASSWGCELKYVGDILFLAFFFVSLFMRLWVEMILVLKLQKSG